MANDDMGIQLLFFSTIIKHKQGKKKYFFIQGNKEIAQTFIAKIKITQCN